MRDRRLARFTRPWTCPGPHLSVRSPGPTGSRLRRRRRPPPLRKFASHAPNLRKQHECAVCVVSDLTTEDASPDYGQSFRNRIREGLPTIQKEPARSAPLALFFPPPDMPGGESPPTRSRAAEANRSGLPVPPAF